MSENLSCDTDSVKFHLTQDEIGEFVHSFDERLQAIEQRLADHIADTNEALREDRRMSLLFLETVGEFRDQVKEQAVVEMEQV